MQFLNSASYSQVDSKSSAGKWYQKSWSGIFRGRNNAPSSSDYELQHDHRDDLPSPPTKSPSAWQYTNVIDPEDERTLENFEKSSTSTVKVATGYDPLFTRRSILLCFAALWILIIVSLQIIYSVSEAQKGLVNTTGSLRYLWAYGPTAVLVVFTVLWRQVDYATKYVQPWAELARGPLPAERTILLDYITPLHVVAFWRAVKLKHAAVASAILVFVLIKVLTVISTGLLVLDVIPFEELPQQMRPLTFFNTTGGLPVNKVDARAAMALYGAKTYDMLLPNGTTNQYAYQLFEPTPASPNGTYAFNASVDVFLADGWECETGTLTYQNATDHQPTGDSTGYEENSPTMMYYNTSIKLPDCEIHHGHLDAPSWMYETNDTAARYGYWGIFQAVNCSNLDPTDSKFKRFIVSVAYSVGRGQDENLMLNSSNVVCVPTYRVQPAFVNLFLNGTSDPNIQFTGLSRQLDNVSPADIALAVQSSLTQAQLPRTFNTAEVTSDGFLTSMIDHTTNFETAMLMNTTWLAEKSKVVYQQNAAQVAGLYLLSDSPADAALLEGSIARNEQRLVVKSLPTRLMQGFSALMLVLTLIMILTMPRGVIPRPVESVAAIAVIVARSPRLRELLKNTGHLDMKQLRQVVAGFQFSSSVTANSDGRTFSIQVVDSSKDSTFVPPKENRIHWARPLVLHRIVMTLTLLLAVAVLITLEVLYRKSVDNSGIANVDPAAFERYAWLYVPTIVLVLLATTFNILDFELEFTDPYHELARGYTHAAASLLWDPLRTVSIRTALQALQHSRFALVASSLSVIFAPFLTITVSGLFETRAVPHTQDITAHALTWFNSSPSDDYTAIGGLQEYAIPALILQGNMSYPQWTWDEMAFPSIDISSRTTGVANSSEGTIVVEMSAARAYVNCTLIPETAYGNLTAAPEGNTYEGYVYYNISQPDPCGNLGMAGDEGFVWRQGTIKKPLSGNGYIGEIIGGSGESTSARNETVQCPSYYVAFGRVTGDVLEDWSCYSCYTGLETVLTNATIGLQQASITSPPTLHDNTSSIFTQYYAPDVQVPYFSPTNLTHNDENFDDFTNVMVYGKDGIPAEQLLDGDVLVSQFTHTYRQWIAQMMNTYMRNDVAELAKNQSNIANTLPDSVVGVYNDPNRHRLFLNEISTRILQGVIAVLLLCGGVIFLLVDMSQVLPKPVGTIGAVASLLAGSRLVDEKSGMIPKGTEWLSDSEIKERGIWAGEQFRMGWWKDDDNEFDQSYKGHDTVVNGRSRDFRIDAKPKLE